MKVTLMTWDRAIASFYADALRAKVTLRLYGGRYRIDSVVRSVFGGKWTINLSEVQS